jgi:GT2 family glycosyltransferase
MAVGTKNETSAGGDADAPLASVVVLGWNGRHFLDDCLSSVLDQDLDSARYEVLYVDNGSVDGSAEFVRQRFPGVRVVGLDHNHGYAEGNNIAFQHTRGESVVFLNQDTVVHRSWLRELIAGVTSAPDIMAAHANVIQPWYPEYPGIADRQAVAATYTAELTPLGYAHYRRLESSDNPKEVLFLHGVSIIIRRRLVEELDYIFDAEMFAYAEDMDLGLRVWALGYRCVVVPAAVVYHKHTLKARLNWRTVRNTARIIRNRYLAFFKVMSLPEFAMVAVLTTVGAPLNAGEFGLGVWRRVLYGLALVPVTGLAAAATLWALPGYVHKRKRVRSRARRSGAWCLRSLLRGVSVLAGADGVRS